MEPDKDAIEVVAISMMRAWQRDSRTVKIVDRDMRPVWRFHAQAAIDAWEKIRHNISPART